MSSANKNNPEARARGYIYAFLTFISVLGKAEADVLHLWFGRRAATRIRSELMATIYAKALVRKDYSGIIHKANEQPRDPDDKGDSSEAQSSTGNKPMDKEGKDGTKKRSGADVGKIVQLMSGDASQVSMVVGYVYLLYVSLLLCMSSLRRMHSREHPWNS